MNDLSENEISEKIIGAAIEVHKELGPGLLESAYETVLFFELSSRNLMVRKQVPVETIYKGHNLSVGFRLDLLVEEKVIIELKSVEKISNIHVAQVLTYLRMSNKKLGLILNFNVRYLNSGIKRVVHNL